MRFALALFAVFLTVLPAVLAYGPPKPSATPTSPGWHCPDRDTQSRGKLDEFCDKPPHKGTLFGCTYASCIFLSPNLILPYSYDNGKGGNYVCTFDSVSSPISMSNIHKSCLRKLVNAQAEASTVRNLPTTSVNGSINVLLSQDLPQHRQPLPLLQSI